MFTIAVLEILGLAGLITASRGLDPQVVTKVAHA